MNTSSKAPVIVSVLIMVAGLGWLLNSFHLLGGVDWIWTLGLAALGLTIVVADRNKVSVVVGPFLVVGAGCAFLRQTGRLAVEHEVPILVIVFGALLLVSHLLPVPLPRYLRD
jgi:hypothetical protein